MCVVPWKGAFGLIFVLFFVSFLFFSFFIPPRLWWNLHGFFLNIFTSNDLIMVFFFFKFLFQLKLDLQIQLNMAFHVQC